MMKMTSREWIPKKERKMNKHAWRIFSIFAVILLICSTTTLLAAETSLEKKAFNSGKVILNLADSPLKAMTETPFAVTVVGDTGIVIKDAKLSIAMDMPAMPMPPNNPVAKWDDGAYRGKAIFTMAGAWQITINIQRPGYDQEQVIFDIEQVMMK